MHGQHQADERDRTSLATLSQGISQCRIALELGVSRNTVTLYAVKTPAPRSGDSPSPGHAPHGASPVSNDQAEPKAPHGPAQFDKERRHIARRLATETDKEQHLYH